MGRGRRRDRLSRYTVFITPAALREVRGLPGNMRQRVKRAIGEFAENPRPPGSKALSVPEVEAEVRRVRLDQWRIVYAVTEAERLVDVLAVRRRPPYDYADLQDLIARHLPTEDE
jgi:mRNA interferase RelE/StbE